MTRNEIAARNAEVMKNVAKNAATSGEYLRALIMKGGKTDDEMLTEMKRKFSDSAATRSDVSWNRGFLKKNGLKFPDPVRAARAEPKPAAKAKGKPAAKPAAKAKLGRKA